MNTGTVSKVSLKNSLNTGTGISVERNWSNRRWEIWTLYQMFIQIFIFWKNPNCFHYTKVTLGKGMVFWFSPKHRNTKRKRPFTFCPSQLSKVYSKVHLNEVSDIRSIFDCKKISTNVAKCVWVVQTFSRHNFFFACVNFPYT